MEQSLCSHRRGVTWIEWVAVIVICLVVFAILFPVLVRNRHHHGFGSCASNMKQIGLAMIQYAQDNSGMMPPGTQPPPGLGWAGQAYPYGKSVYLFRCPDDTPLEEPQAAAIVSYAYNSNIPRWFSRQKQPSSIPNPAATVSLFEVAGDRMQKTANSTVALDEGAAQGARQFSAAGDGTATGLHSTMRGADHIRYATGELGGRPSGTNNQFNEPRHQGASNFLMADCHVKWYKPGQVSTGTDAPTPTAAQSGTIFGTAAGTANPNYAATFSVK